MWRGRLIQRFACGLVPATPAIVQCASLPGDSTKKGTGLPSTNLDKICCFVSGHQFDELQWKSAVLVLGRNGVGKSTLIAIQQGADAEQNAKGDFDIVASQVRTPQTSKGFNSKTLNAGVYEDKRNKMLYIDTAGLNENRGINEKLWTTWSTAKVLSLLQKVEAVIVVVDFDASFGNRGAGLRELAECLLHIVGQQTDENAFYKNIVPVFTNAFRCGKTLEKSDLISTMKELLESEEEKLENKLNDLRERYKRKVLLPREDGEFYFEFTMNDVPPEERHEVQNGQAVLALLKAFLKAQGRCMISCPVDARACRVQREQLDQIVRDCPGIDKPALSDIVHTRETNDHTIVSALADLLTRKSPHLKGHSFASLLRDHTDSYEQLVSLFNKQAKMINAVTNNWHVVKEELVAEQEKRKLELQEEIKAKEKERAHLKVSTKLIPLYVKEVRKERTSGLLSWTLFGYGWAEEDFSYHGQWYETYSTHGKHFSETDVGQVGKPKNKLSMTLKSVPGHNLHVDVKLLREEKDHPASINRVADLSKQIEKLEEHSKGVQQEVCALRAAANRHELIKAANHDIVEEEKRLQDINNRLAGPALPTGKAEQPCSAKFTLDRLAVLFTSLKNSPEGLPADLAGQQAITDFLSDYERRTNLCKLMSTQPDMKTYLDRDITNNLNLKPASAAQEDEKPKSHVLRVAASRLIENLPDKSQASAEAFASNISSTMQGIPFKDTHLSLTSSLMDRENWLAFGCALWAFAHPKTASFPLRSLRGCGTLLMVFGAQSLLLDKDSKEFVSCLLKNLI